MTSVDAGFPERELRALGAADRRRRRQRLAWTAAAAAAAILFLLLAWEAAAGPAGSARPFGYGVAAVAAGLAGALLARKWRKWRVGDADPAALIGRLARLFPQTRGLLADAFSTQRTRPSLAAARARSGRAWFAQRGVARLDHALAADLRAETARRRRLALSLIGLTVAVAAAQPAAARRLATALRDPGTVFGEPAGRWNVSPGDATIAYGEAVEGRARFAGSAARGPLVLESRQAEARWRAVTLAVGPAGSWRWPSVASPVRYRLRFGPFSSPIYTIEVEAPFGLVSVEARVRDGAWEPLAARVIAAGTALELRGRATGPLASAAVRVDDREFPLDVDGRRLSGTLAPPAGRAEIVVRNGDGSEVTGAPFTIVPSGGVFVDILRPADDPVELAAEGAWLEARAGAPDGLAALLWQTADGREGVLGPVAGSRDTTVTALAMLAEGAAPGDTLRYRVVARGAGGGVATSPWRTALVAPRAALAAATDQARADAVAEVERAVRAAAGREAEGGGEGDAVAVDRRLRNAADSLARALERTLADPDLPPALAERLEGYRRLLEGAADAPLAVAPDPSGSSLLYDPAAAASARASVLEEIRRGVAETDSLIRLSAAADTLVRLSGRESALAERTLAADSGAMTETIAPEQEAVAAAARQAAAPLPDSLAAGIEEALAAVGQELAQGDPQSAAAAQRSAAATLSRAAAGAQRMVDQAAAVSATRRAAIDRAGAETLFLAELQRELAERMRIPAAGADQHAARVARQQVVTRGLEASLGTLVDAIGGRPAGVDIARRLAEAVFATRFAEEAVASPPWREGEGAGAAAAAATALTRLSRALLLPAEEGGGSGAGGEGGAGQAAGELSAMAGAERSLADRMAGSRGPSADRPSSGGNAEAAAIQRGIGRRLAEQAAALAELGVDPNSVEALQEAVESAAVRLERGLPGARAETDLRALARRLADLGRIVERSRTECRQSETARGFLPAEPPPLPPRTTAPRLDPAAEMAAWRDILPRSAWESSRAYLERLAREGVRAPGSGP